MANPKPTGTTEGGTSAPAAPVEPAREANHPDEPKRPAPTATSDDTARVARKPVDYTSPEQIQLPAEHKRPSLDEFREAGNDPKDYEARMVAWENEIRQHLAVGHKYPALVKRLPGPLAQKVPPPSPKLGAGMVRVRAKSTVLSGGLSFNKDDEFTMTEAQAKRAESKGAVKILKS